MDTLKITITDTGLFKVETDGISEANHGNAEMLLRIMFEKAGGKPTRTLKPNTSLHHALHAHAADGHTHGTGPGGGHTH